MKKSIPVAILGFLLGASNLMAQNNVIKDLIKVNYPYTSKIGQTDTYFGTPVEDPYRWLEDDRSSDTEKWVSRQNNTTFGYLDNIPFREALKNRLESLWNYEKLSAPFTEGDYTYFYKNNGLQNQYVVYRKNSAGEEEVFLDPNTFSEDGTTSLMGLSFTKAGSKAASLISAGGSDWRKAIVIQTKNKEMVGDTLVDIKFSGISWKGNEGFFYSS